MGQITKMVHSVETAVDIAIHIEQRGRDFFMKVKDQVKDPQLMSLFSFLAAEEERHLGLYRDLLARVSGGAFQEAELVGGYGEFIRALSDEVLQSLENLEYVSAEDSIAVALRFEKDTLLFFQEIKQVLRDPDAHIIERICQEEKNHILRLMDYKRNHAQGVEREKIGTYT